MRLMNLHAYLEQHNMNDGDFASRIGISRSMVTKLRNLQTKPSADTALKIQDVTNGEVMLSDLMQDCESGSKKVSSDGAA